MNTKLNFRVTKVVQSQSLGGGQTLANHQKQFIYCRISGFHLLNNLSKRKTNVQKSYVAVKIQIFAIFLSQNKS